MTDQPWLRLSFVAAEPLRSGQWVHLVDPTHVEACTEEHSFGFVLQDAAAGGVVHVHVMNRERLEQQRRR